MGYSVNEIFGPTLQGEGARTGTVNFWLRFAGCNLTCRIESEGFDCDTDFSNGRKLEAAEIVDELRRLGAKSGSWVVISGGEPSLQLDRALVDALHEAGLYLAVETNGTHDLPPGVEWISVSPKTAEHTLRLDRSLVDELRYVRAEGQALPKPRLSANYYFISPAFEADGSLKRGTLEWCKRLVLENPTWRLSVQTHKLLGVR